MKKASVFLGCRAERFPGERGSSAAAAAVPRSAGAASAPLGDRVGRTEERRRAARGTESCAGSGQEDRRTEELVLHGFLSITTRGGGTGEGEELFKPKDNAGTSTNGCQRLPITGGRKEIGGILCMGGQAPSGCPTG